ncbi:MAG: hypothetical protein K2X86_02745 [Cytophagaceae bacterium]|nr:hypothetical protein [Cytophagaceae bacterium]
MNYLNNLNPDLQLQALLSEAKTLLKEEGDLNKEKKEDLFQILEQVDFLLGKHDDIYNKFSDIFAAMAGFDFSKRLSYYEDGDNFVNFIINGINILNEEFQSDVIKKKILHDLFDSINLKDTLLVITNPEGFIYFANSGNAGLTNFNDKSLADQSINILFSDFTIVENCIKDKDSSMRDIEINFKWKGKNIPAKMDVTISNTLGKIETLIYIIKLSKSEL